MPHKVTINNVETEVFTQEELDAKVDETKKESDKAIEDASTKSATEAVEKYQRNNPDKTKDLETANNKLKETEDALAKATEGDSGDEGDNDSAQIVRLRQERDNAKKEADEEIKDMRKNIETIMSTVVGNVKEDLMTKFSGEDKDLREKIELHFDSFKGDAVTKEEITTRMESAFKLATNKEPTKDVLDGITSGGSKGIGEEGEGEEKKELTENAKEISKVLGITGADIKKYGPGGEKAPKSV